MEYKPRTSIKGQVLADFVAEFQGKDMKLGQSILLGLRPIQSLLNGNCSWTARQMRWGREQELY